MRKREESQASLSAPTPETRLSLDPSGSSSGSSFDSHSRIWYESLAGVEMSAHTRGSLSHLTEIFSTCE